MVEVMVCVQDCIDPRLSGAQAVQNMVPAAATASVVNALLHIAVLSTVKADAVPRDVVVWRGRVTVPFTAPG